TGLAGEPPLFDVVVGRERPGIQTAEVARGDEQRRRREAEVVGLLVVEQAVERLVALLPRGLRAVGGGRGARRVDRLVGFGRAPGAEVVPGRLLRRVRYGALVEDPVRVRLDAQLPADDPG